MSDQLSRKALKRLLDASARIEAIYQISGPLKPSDERPVSHFIPGAWPTMGDLRELVEAADEARKITGIKKP